MGVCRKAEQKSPDLKGESRLRSRRSLTVTIRCPPTPRDEVVVVEVQDLPLVQQRKTCSDKCRMPQTYDREVGVNLEKGFAAKTNKSISKISRGRTSYRESNGRNQEPICSVLCQGS
ncbi:uncharacterized protein LOC127799013 [Diospyros lotus]|uniref:uncharacterized protein LOC127799013 n=1 Tax=Diospyros lotus TaxID=55363 RepID=UPI002259091C|nr:uncharacterized protein LOC127799013 [Diospyros lotus]